MGCPTTGWACAQQQLITPPLPPPPPQNWDAASAKFGSGFMLWAGIVGAAISHFGTRAEWEDVSAWFAVHPLGSAERKVQQCLEGIRGRVWRAHIMRGEPTGVVEAVAGILKSA